MIVCYENSQERDVSVGLLNGMIEILKNFKEKTSVSKHKYLRSKNSILLFLQMLYENFIF